MRRVIHAALLLASCAREVVVPIAAERGEVVVVAIGGADGTVRAASVLATDGTQPSLRLGLEEAVFSWRMPVTAAAPAASVRLASEPAPAGSCGRCLAPSIGPPFIALEGSACPPPAWAGSGVGADGAPLSAEVVRAAASAVRIDVAGACACPLPEPRKLAGVRVCPLLPESRPWTVQASAVGSDGTVLLAASGFARLVRPAGEVVEARVDLGTHPTAAEIFGDAPVLTSEIGPTGHQRFTLLRLDASLREEERVDTLEATGLLADGDRLFVLGSQRGSFTQVPAVERCERQPAGGLLCEDEPVDVCPSNPDTSMDRPATSGGGLAGWGNGGGIYVRTAEPRWRCAASTPRALVTSIGQVMDPRIGAVTVIGDRAFACATDPDSSHTFVLTGSVAAAGPPRELRLVLESASRCAGITREGDGARVWLDVLGAADLDGRGRVVARRAIGELGAPEQVGSISAGTPGWTIAVGYSGAVYVRPDGGAWRRVYGDGVRDETIYRAIAPLADGSFAAFRAGAVYTVRPVDAAACRFEVSSRAIPALPRGTILASEAPDGFYVATATAVLRVSREGAVAPSRAAPLRRGESYAAVGSAAGGVAFATNGGDVVWLSGEEARVLESPRAWSSMGARAGVAWLGGKGAIGRVVPGNAGPVLEDDWLDRLGGASPPRPRADVPEVSATGVTCPDVASFGFAELFQGAGRSADQASSLWHVQAPDADCTVASPLALCPHPAVEAAREAYREDRPVAIHDLGRGVVIVFSDATLGIPGKDHLAVPLSKIHRSVLGATGVILVGGNAATLAAVVPVFED